MYNITQSRQFVGMKKEQRIGSAYRSRSELFNWVNDNI